MYVFKHALVQDAAYDSLLKSKRIELHQRIAEALEKHFGDTAETAPEVIARHYTAAGLAGRAVPYWLNAGRNAMARAANQEAIGHLDRGLELQRSLAPSHGREERELDLLLEMGEAQGRSGKDVEAMRTFEQAAELSNALGFPERLAQAALGCALAASRMGVPSATSIRLLHQADRALPPGDSMLKAQVLARLAVQLVIAGEPEQSKALRENAGAMAQRLDGFADVAGILFIALVIGPWSPQVVEQVEIMLPGMRENIKTALLAGEKERARDMFFGVTAASARLRDVPAALAELQQFERLAEEQRQPFNLYWVATFRAALALFAGKFEESKTLAGKALSIGRSVHGLNAEGMFGVQMFGVARERGQLKELAPLIDRFVSSTAQDSTWRPGLALIYAELGMLERARKEFEELAAKNFAAVPNDGTWLNCMCMLAEVCCMLGDVARSSELYAALLPYARCNVVAPPTIACYGALTRHLGMLATTLCRWEDAERHFEDALASNLQQGGLPWAAHTRYQYAAMLRARGLQEDAERSSNLLAEALKTAQSLGMNALIERVALLADGAGSEAAVQPR